MHQYIRTSDLVSSSSLTKIQNRVLNTLSYAVHSSSKQAVVDFLLHYASWNGKFADGVAALAGRVGEARDIFIDPGQPKVVADRSVYLAGMIFDAARDEFDDHIHAYRDSHRCLAQACVMAAAKHYGIDLNRVFEGSWIHARNASVLSGYLANDVVLQSGSTTMSSIYSIFSGWGYHLGSELLADQEFSIIDQYLREHAKDLVHDMMRSTFTFAGGTHRGYMWIGIHSGHGSGVEAEHFDIALEGVNQALGYLDPSYHTMAVRALMEGFKQFDLDHQRFFEDMYLHLANQIS